MNKEEAKRVLEIMALADGGCIYCGSELFNQFIKEFPKFTDIAKKTFKNRYNSELEAAKDIKET